MSWLVQITAVLLFFVFFSFPFFLLISPFLCSCCCFSRGSQSLSATNWPCWQASCWPTATYQPLSSTASSMRTWSRKVRRTCSKKFLSRELFIWVWHSVLVSPPGVSAAFAVKLFKSWINEKDINSVAASLRKVGMDNRLMVRASLTPALSGPSSL